MDDSVGASLMQSLRTSRITPQDSSSDRRYSMGEGKGVKVMESAKGHPSQTLQSKTGKLLNLRGRTMLWLNVSFPANRSCERAHVQPRFRRRLYSPVG